MSEIFKLIPVPEQCKLAAAVIAKYKRFYAWKMEFAYLKMMGRNKGERIK